MRKRAAPPPSPALPRSVKIAFGAPAVAGLAFTAFILHGLRLGAARKMTPQPLPDAVVPVHLEDEVERMRSDTSRSRGANGRL